MSPFNTNRVPGLSLPGPQESPATVRNNNTFQRWAKTISPRMYAVDQPLFNNNDAITFNAAPPTPPTDAYVQIAGWQSIVFSSGNGTLVLPKPFVNGVLSLTITPIVELQFFWVWILLPFVADATSGFLTNCKVFAGSYSAGTISAATGTFEVAYNAIGW